MAWASLFSACINSALDGGVESSFVEDTVDPIKKNLVLSLRDKLEGRDSWNSIQTLAHGYASANDCVIHKIKRKGEKTYIAEVLIKHRGGPVMTNDPFLMDTWKSGNQKRRERYIKMIRDKDADSKKGLLQ